MGNAWTQLVQEAASRGGPDAMRAAYQNSGRAQGAIAVTVILSTGAAVAIWAWKKLPGSSGLIHRRSPRATRPTDDPAPPRPSSGSGTGSEGEGEGEAQG